MSSRWGCTGLLLPSTRRAAPRPTGTSSSGRKFATRFTDPRQSTGDVARTLSGRRHFGPSFVIGDEIEQGGGWLARLPDLYLEASLAAAPRFGAIRSGV